MSSLARIKRPTLGQTLIQARNQQKRIEELSSQLETLQAYAVGQQRKVAELTNELAEARSTASAAAAMTQRPEL